MRRHIINKRQEANNNTSNKQTSRHAIIQTNKQPIIQRDDHEDSFAPEESPGEIVEIPPTQRHDDHPSPFGRDDLYSLSPKYLKP